MGKFYLENKMRILQFIICIFCLNSCQSKFVKRFYDFSNADPEPVIENVKVALVLGGGGSRAIAQIGVIEVLEENNIPVNLVVGTSGGSIIGAIYADNPSIVHLKEFGLNFKRENLARISFEDAIEGARSLRGGFDGSVGERFLEQNLMSKYFHELKIPFIAVATDINSGKTIGLKSGRIAPAVRASCAIPGLFSPVEINKMLLVDGGVTAPLPVEIARQYNPEVIIAVDVSTPIEDEKISNMLDLVTRSANLSYNVLTEFNGKQADILLKPNLKGAGMFDDHRNKELYEEGRKEALLNIKKIKKILSDKAKNKK
jgi:NTE family protein